MSSIDASAHGTLEHAARSIAFLGGTGPLGRGLALRLATAGHECLLGSRSADRAQDSAEELRERGVAPARGSVLGTTNADAVARAEIIVVSVPYDAMADTLRAVADAVGHRIVVCCVNALTFDADGPRPLRIEAGSAAEECADLLPTARVVAAFHHVSATTLLKPRRSLDSDVLIAGDDEHATGVVAALVDQVGGARPVLVGPLRLAQPIEDLTAVLISVNKRYRAHAGLMVTDLPADTSAG